LWKHGSFLGWIGDDVLHSLYRIADLCVVPSIYEPFGLVALEAMASGCPCIVADTGGLREVVPLGERVGLRFNGGDASHLGVSIDRLARVLQRLGVEPGDRVATFAWNNQRHFELYFAIPCVGAVLHTLNIRLFEEQLTYIVNHAKDKVIFIDDSLVPLLDKLAPSFEHVVSYVVMGDGDVGSLPGALRYEELLQEA